jgi:hypothetical protein
MNITLTPEIERALVEEARRLGTTPESLAIESLRERFVAPHSAKSTEMPGETLADRLGDLIGILDSSEHIPGGARMSEDTGRQFAEILLDRRRQGRL